MKNIDQAVSVMRQIMEEEELITHISNAHRFLLRTMRKEIVLTLKTTNKWSFEVVLDESGVTHLSRVKDHKGRKLIGWLEKPVPIDTLLNEAEKIAFDTEIYHALSSVVPL